MNRWIDIKEEKPKEGEVVNVIYKIEREVEIAEDEFKTEFITKQSVGYRKHRPTTEEDAWTIWTGEGGYISWTDNVTHWMPLPAPPKEIN